MTYLYVGVAVVAYLLITGMLFHDVQHIWRDDPAGMARERREHLGTSMLFAMVFASVWPFGLIVVFLLTGFAEHGVWRQR